MADAFAIFNLVEAVFMIFIIVSLSQDTTRELRKQYGEFGTVKGATIFTYFSQVIWFMFQIWKGYQSLIYFWPNVFPRIF